MASSKGSRLRRTFSRKDQDMLPRPSRVESSGLSRENELLLPINNYPVNYNSDSAVYERTGDDHNASINRGESNDSRYNPEENGGYYGSFNEPEYPIRSPSDDEDSDRMMDREPHEYRMNGELPIITRYQSTTQPVIPTKKPSRGWLKRTSHLKLQNPALIYGSGSDSNTSAVPANYFTRRTRMRNIQKLFREPPSVQKLRVSVYCTCDQLQLFKLLKWLDRTETGQLPGAELNPDGWKNKMYLGAVHSICAIPPEDGDSMVSRAYRQKDVFYLGTGCTVFWGLTRTEEQAHLQALEAFSINPVKQVEVEDMDYTYGDVSRVLNDAITLSSNRPSEKLAISFAMAQSAKLDVFEERVGETILETKHVPLNLATTGSIQYSQKDISKLIGRLFIERNDVNLNSDMLDEPEFFWEYDEYEPLYRKMLKYLDVDNRVHILNTRLDILRELLDVLSQQLAHQHDTKLEWIVIWLIVAEVVVQIVWNMIIKDILGFFPRSSDD